MTQEHFTQLFRNLSKRELFVIGRRFGLGGLEPGTLEEIGQELDVTRERVRQIEAKALHKLRISASTNRVTLAEFCEL